MRPRLPRADFRPAHVFGAVIAALALLVIGCGGGGGGGVVSTTTSTTSTATTAGTTTSTSTSSTGAPPAGVVDHKPVLQISGMNQSGVMSGNGYPGSFNVGYSVSASGRQTALPDLAGGTQTMAQGINNSGNIVGQAIDSGGNMNPVIWMNLTPTVLPGVGDSAISPLYYPLFINSSNQIVGYRTYSSTGSSGQDVTQGLFWSSPSATPVALGPSGFVPTSLSDNGLVGGISSSSSKLITEYTVKTDGTGLTQVAQRQLSGITTFIPEVIVNSAGAVAFVDSSGNVVFQSAAGAQTPLGIPGTPKGMNTQGDVVGLEGIKDSDAFLFAQGKVTDLQNTVGTSHYELKSATAINDSGLIAGDSFSTGVGASSFTYQLPAGTFQRTQRQP